MIGALLLVAGMSPAQPLPDLPASLEAAHTLAVVGVEDLAGAARRAELLPGLLRAAWAEREAPGVRLPLHDLVRPASAVPPAALTGADLLAAAFRATDDAAGLGIDVRRPDDWARIGIDAAAGVAVVYDARLTVADGERSRALPVLLVGQGQVARLLDHLAARLGGPAVRVSATGAVEQWRLADRVDVLAGHRESHVAVLDPGPTGARPGVVAGFSAFLTGRGPGLARDPTFRGAMGDLGASPRLYAYATQRFGLLFAPAGLLAEATARVRAVGLWIAPGQVGAHVLLTPEGQASAATHLTPTDLGSPLARFLPSAGLVGHAVRLSPASLAALLAPFSPGAGDLAAALTGQAVLAGDAATVGLAPQPDGRPRWLFLAGVTSVAAADDALARLQAAAGERPPLDTLSGRSAFALKVLGTSVRAVRIGLVVVVSPDLELLKSIASRPTDEALEGEVTRALRLPAAWALFGDLAPALEAARIASGANPAGAQWAAALEALRGPDHPRARWTLETDSLRLSADSLGGAALLTFVARLVTAAR